MSDLEKAARQALKALEKTGIEGTGEMHDAAITALRQALEQPKQEPVSHTVVAGALFDFMGWLTTRNERLILSITDDAFPAVEAIKEFAMMRGLSLDDAQVQDWQNMTGEQPNREWVGLTDEEIERGLKESWVTEQAFESAVWWADAKLKEKNT